MTASCFDLAQRFVGMKEAPGVASNPAILAMLRLDGAQVEGDETAWCSAFVNYIAWLLRLPRSKSLAARSWLTVGVAIDPSEAIPENDVVVLWRVHPDSWQGHVGFFAGVDLDDAGERRVHILGGNQGDQVSVASFPASQVLGVRRLA
jgi:uncharacterized protein (TIGR02594 family)